MTKEELMHRAIELSKNSVKTGGGPFGAVIAKDGIIIAEASNSVTIDLDPTAHAEVNCVRQACFKLKTFNLEGCRSIHPASHVQCAWVLSTGHISTVSIMPTTERMRQRLVSTMSLSTRRLTAR